MLAVALIKVQELGYGPIFRHPLTHLADLQLPYHRWSALPRIRRQVHPLVLKSPHSNKYPSPRRAPHGSRAMGRPVRRARINIIRLRKWVHLIKADRHRSTINTVYIYSILSRKAMPCRRLHALLKLVLPPRKFDIDLDTERRDNALSSMQS